MDYIATKNKTKLKESVRGETVREQHCGQMGPRQPLTGV